MATPADLLESVDRHSVRNRLDDSRIVRRGHDVVRPAFTPSAVPEQAATSGAKSRSYRASLRKQRTQKKDNLDKTYSVCAKPGLNDLEQPASDFHKLGERQGQQRQVPKGFM